MLSLAYETVPALYDPEVVRGNPPVPSEPASPIDSGVGHRFVRKFCRAISLETNNQVDWFIHWNDYGDVEAFFLNPGYPGGRRPCASRAA